MLFYGSYPPNLPQTGFNPLPILGEGVNYAVVAMDRSAIEEPRVNALYLRNPFLPLG